MKRLVIFITLVLMIFLFSGCGILKELKQGADDAFVLAENFCKAVSEDDFVSAENYLHPDCTPSKEELKSFISGLEKACNIDFSDGIAFKSRSWTRSAYYDSSYGGTVHEINYTMVVGQTTTEIFFTVVTNGNGYGIYSFGINRTLR